jgi:hypothetical protein
MTTGAPSAIVILSATELILPLKYSFRWMHSVFAPVSIMISAGRGVSTLERDVSDGENTDDTVDTGNEELD